MSQPGAVAPLRLTRRHPVIVGALETPAAAYIGSSVSLMFGAVVPIEFGPLNGQGRLAAGVYITKSEEKGRLRR